MGDFNLTLILPVVTLAAFGLLALLFAPALKGQARVLGGISLLGIVVAAASAVRLWTLWRVAGPLESAGGMVRVDGFGLYLSLVLLAVGALTVVASLRFLEREEADHGEFYPLVLLALAGMLSMVMTSHLIMVLIGLEVFSLSLYVLTGLTRGRARSVESSLKYFLLGAFSTGFLLYGIAGLYVATGSLDVAVIAKAPLRGNLFALIGMGLLLVGFGFKIASVPFHMWTPDVYEGAPTPVVAFFAAAPKLAAMVLFARLLAQGFGGAIVQWQQVLVAIGLISVGVGAFAGLAQSNLKRLWAYSSIANVGYAIIGLASGNAEGVQSMLTFMVLYMVDVTGFFACLSALSRRGKAMETMDDMAGLFKEQPGIALAMTAFSLSALGLPPFSGFWAKVFVFKAALGAGLWGVAVLGLVGSVVAAFYYLRLIKVMWLDPAPGQTDAPPGAARVVAYATALFACPVVLIALQFLDVSATTATLLVSAH